MVWYSSKDNYCNLYRYLIEKYLKNQEANFSKGQNLEGLYTFDVHCNGFVPLYFFTVILQFFSLPVVLNEGFLAAAFSNTLYMVGLIYYFYCSLLCYYCKDSKY